MAILQQKMESESSNNIHVVLLPYLAFGHMMPFHQLAIALAKSGLHVSYVSTPKNIERLPKLPPNLSPLIDFVSLPLPILETHPLPEGAEATVDVPMEQSHNLTMAYDLLQQPFKQFVSAHSPDWLIIDFVPHWAIDVAQECGVPVLAFSALSSAARLFFGPPEYLTGDGRKRVRPFAESLTSPPEWVNFPSSVAYHTFEAIGTMTEFYGENNPSGTSTAARIAKTIRASQAVAVRSCRELEGEYLSLFAELICKPVIPVGLLPPEQPIQREIIDGSWIETFKWLDGQQPKSVVFVGFGSECKLSKEEVYEIADGLEAAELPFLWALRKPSWAVNELDALPPGFSQWNSDKQKVCIGWAPQMEILAHPAVGGSLFHAGWGSAIEMLQFGHSLVVLPLIFDQPLNARLLVEKGLAVEVERGEDGSFSGDGIAKALRLAMVEKEGEGMRVRLREVAAVASDRMLHDQYVDQFVEYLKNGVPKKN